MGNLELNQVPETFYVFVDQANTMTWHNFNMVGQLCSSSFVAATEPSTAQDYANGTFEVLPYVSNPNYVPTFMSPFMAGILAPLGVEIDAERFRRLMAPEAPSRLLCTYAFGSYADCCEAARRYGWALGEVHEFKAVPDAYLRVRRVNMEIVSLALTAYARSATDESVRTALWSAYWNGLDNLVLELPAPPPTLRSQMASGCLWEYLIDGCVQRV